MSQTVTLVKTKQNKRKQLKTTNIGGKCWQHTRWLESLGKPNKNYILEEKSPKNWNMLGQWKEPVWTLSISSNKFTSQSIILQFQIKIWQWWCSLSSEIDWRPVKGLSSHPVTAGGLQHPLNPELDKKKTDGGMDGLKQRTFNRNTQKKLKNFDYHHQ